MSKKLELQKKLGSLVEEQRSLLNQLGDGVWAADQQEQVSKMDDDIMSLERQIQLVAKAEERGIDEAKKTQVEAKEEVSKRDLMVRGLRDFAKNGSISESYKDVLVGANDNLEARAQGTLTSAAGGILVPTELQNVIIKQLLAFGGVYEISNRFNTTGGNPLVFATNDDTSRKATIVGQGANVGTAADMVFGSKTFGAYKYSTGILPINQELIDDASFNIESEVLEALGTGMARGFADDFIKGNGSTAPEGIVTALTALGAGGIGVNAAASALTADNLLDLSHSINRAYRTSSAKYVLSDATLAVVRKLKTTTGEYLWQYPDIQKGVPGTLFGYQYQVCDELDGVATGKMSVLFGDFSKYRIRLVGSPVIKRTQELLMTTDQIGFLMLQRMDAKFMLPGSIKALKHA